MNAIEATKLTVRKDKATVLHGINFAISSGTITCLIGPSGAGKTTVMRSIIGVQNYDGTITVLDAPAGSAHLRRKIGYVTQHPAVYDDLTVRQNLAYFASIVGVGKAHIKQTIDTVELHKQANQLVGSLSGGQRARVSLAIALLGEPELLVLDEPTVGLDPVLREKLWQLFERLAHGGKTLLVSSHVMDEADRCDDLLVVRDGRVLWNDTRTKLLDKTKSKNVEAAFLTMIGDES